MPDLSSVPHSTHQETSHPVAKKGRAGAGSPPGWITVLGSMNMDLVSQVARLPEEGQTIFGSDFRTVPGGKGANQAVAAARLGVPVRMIGACGTDTLGDQLLQGLSAEGIDISGVARIPDRHTGVATILVDEKGSNFIVVVSGANATVLPASLPSGWLADTFALLLQLEIPMETVLEAARHAREAGVLTVLDPAPAVPLPDALLASLDLITPNESETRTLTGIDPQEPAAMERAAGSLLERGARTVILKLGARGAYLATDSGIRSHIPAPRVKAVDTTAAGDAFNAGLVTALREGRDLEEAVAFAHRVAALSVTRFGAQPSLPTRAEVDAFLAP